MHPATLYRGRFAPSPTGPLHAGSLVAALASWLDARAHGGQWLVRIEDVDTPRTVPGATEHMLRQLRDCALVSDEPVVLQCARMPLYQAALDQLRARALAYPCSCSRKDIASALQQQGHSRARNCELVYPGTCRPRLRAAPGIEGTAGAATLGTTPTGTPRCAWRLRTDVHMENGHPALVKAEHSAINTVAFSMLHWHDRRLGAQQQNVCTDVGDFVLRRADGCFTYQLAVVVDDAAQGITHVVRGADLADNTARQILLQRALALPTPLYLHTPLVLGANGEKLSKQNGAQALDTSTPHAALAALRLAATVLGLPSGSPNSIPQALADWVAAWPTALARLASESIPAQSG